MRIRSGLYLLLPTLIFVGCASNQPIDAQSASQQELESRVAKLEADQTALTARLDQLGPTGSDLKNQLDALRYQVESQHAAPATLSGRLDNQATALSELSGKVAVQGSALTALSGKVDNQAIGLAQAKETADDAVKIARDSRMVSGKIIDSLRLADDMVLYDYEQPELTAKGKGALDELIKRAVPQLPYIFIEIIGYSDDASLDSQNRRIALERAESVRRYLFEVGGIPLHRMSVISYGDLKPIASNDSFEGRSRNRRVMVQVLK
ncbi:MAG: OmpA family protein [Thiobacillaceae bacterium]